jgi:hypothetical protein
MAVLNRNTSTITSQHDKLKIQLENSKPIEKPGHKVTGLSGACRMIAGLPMLGYK